MRHGPDRQALVVASGPAELEGESPTFPFLRTRVPRAVAPENPRQLLDRTTHHPGPQWTLARRPTRDHSRACRPMYTKTKDAKSLLMR